MAGRFPAAGGSRGTAARTEKGLDLSMKTPVFALAAAVAALPAVPAMAAPADLQKQFDSTVRPFVGKYCAGCHSGAQPTAQFDIKSYTSLDQVIAEFPRWELVAQRLTNKEMPPKPVP